jgi:hypothetical protein
MLLHSARGGPLLCPHCGYPVASGGHRLLREERRTNQDPHADREIVVTPIWTCETMGADFIHEQHTRRVTGW